MPQKPATCAQEAKNPMNYQLAIQLLEEQEWGRWSDGYQTCPVCKDAYKYGHAQNCKLARCLKAAGKTPKMYEE